MATTAKRCELTPAEQLRAVDCLELIRLCSGSEEDHAALERFHQDGEALAKLMGEFDAMLLADYITVVPDEHTNCEAGYVLGELTEVMSRYLRRWCAYGGGARAAFITAEFLIECMSEVDVVHQFLADVRQNNAIGLAPIPA